MPALVNFETQALRHIVGENPLLCHAEAEPGSHFGGKRRIFLRVGGDQDDIEFRVGFPDLAQRLEFRWAVNASHGPECKNERFALTCGENFRQTARDKRMNGFASRDQRREEQKESQ